MDNRNDFQVTGHELGCESVEHLVDHVQAICAHERQRIELVNESEILRLRLEIAAWADEEKRIGERLRLAPPPGDERLRRREMWFVGVVALALTVAGFFLSLLAFEPFRLGWKSYLYCVGIALVCPFCVDKCLKQWDCHPLLKGATAIACVAAIASLMLLAVIRGDLVGQQLKDTESQSVVIDDGGPAPQNDNHFYDNALPLLQLTMALLAVAMELGAGLALHELKRLGADSDEDARTIAQELMRVRLHIAALGSGIVTRTNEGAVFEERFQRDFCRAMLTHAGRKALGKVLALALCLTLLSSARVRADEQLLNLVIMIDLSGSVASKGPDGKTDFQKDVAAAADVLAQIPAGTHVTVLGITANSFAEPDILLRANMPQDPGYFGERLAAAHGELVRAWQTRSDRLSPTERQTDILGALLVASQLLRKEPTSRNLLVLYSDMRNTTDHLNLERLRAVDVEANSTALKRHGLIADLRGVSVYVEGVDAAGLQTDQWDRVRRFWEAYFGGAGAALATYETLHETPHLGR